MDGDHLSLAAISECCLLRRPTLDVQEFHLSSGCHGLFAPGNLGSGFASHSASILTSRHHVAWRRSAPQSSTPFGGAGSLHLPSWHRQSNTRSHSTVTTIRNCFTALLDDWTASMYVCDTDANNPYWHEPTTYVIVQEPSSVTRQSAQGR